MAKKELNAMTIEELKQQAISLKTVSWFLGVVLVVFIGYLIYKWFRDSEMQLLIVLPIGLIPILIINITSYKKIKSEIENRTKGEQTEH